MTHDYLAGLDDAQIEAVTASPGPLRVAAGPGAGKTRVLVSRIADLILRGGADPSRILAVTFTNAATEEMRSRLDLILGARAKRVWIGTFHGVASRMIRILGPSHVGLTHRFTIYDADDSKKLVRDILREMILETLSRKAQDGVIEPEDEKVLKSGKPKVKANDVKRVLGVIEMARNVRLTARRLQETDVAPGDAEAFLRYEERLAAANACDFGLILWKALDLCDSIHTKADAAGLFDHVLADEFQDANGTQVDLAYFLARATRSITVVGDADQSLYGWRGAERGGMLRFAREWGEATRTVMLERNYRSTGNIVNAATQFIATNPGRVPTRLFSREPPGSLIGVAALADAAGEADFVGASIGKLIEEGVALSEIAVLYRANLVCRDAANMPSVARSLRSMGVPYRIVKGLRFYDRRAVKDALCWLRLAVNPRDDAALKRIANVPARGISSRTMECARRWAFAHRKPLLDGFRALAEGKVPGAPRGAATKVMTLLLLVTSVEAMAQKSPSAALDACLTSTGYRDALMRKVGGDEQTGLADVEEEELDADEDETPETQRLRVAKGDLAMLDELGQEIRNFEEGAADEDRTVEGFLRHASLLSEADEMEGNAVQLMTVHASKGREYDVVFVIGMEEGIFPSTQATRPAASDDGDMQSRMREAAGRADESDLGAAGIDEEQRICYVALTRARKQATITCAAERFVYGEYWKSQPSRFVEALVTTGLCEVLEAE